MREIVTGNPDHVATQAAQWLAGHLRAACDRHGTAVFAVPGGRSVAGTFKRLAEQDVPWHRVRVVFADERHLPPGDVDRNDRVVAEHLARPLIEAGLLAPEQVLTVPFEEGDVNSAGEQYERILAEAGGAVHVALLGVGEDGHVASLFPGYAAVADHVAGRSTDMVIAVTGAPKPPPERISLSPAFLRTVPAVSLLFSGAAKREAFKRFNDPAVPVSRCPAKLALSANHLLIAADDHATGAADGQT